MENPENKINQEQSPLTSIRDPYTLSNTASEEEGEYNQILINQFLNTLAEIALKVAVRKIGYEQTRNQKSN